MRHFGKDTPEFLTFTIGDSDEVYKLPLPTSMPFETALRFAEVAAIADDDVSNLESMKLQHRLLKEYIGDAADELTTAQVNEIFTAWAEGGREETGVTEGE